MKIVFYIFISSIMTLNVLSQNFGATYRVKFSDKNGSPYSIENPSEFLTERAILRRKKMNIPIQQNDIPVVKSYLNKLTDMGAKVNNSSRWFNSAIIFVSDTLIIPKIEELSFVLSVEKIKPYMRQNKLKTFNNDTQETNKNYTTIQEINKRWCTNYGAGENQIKMINADYLHSLGFRGENMVIAILDAGFYHINTLNIFDSLRNSGRLLGYKDFVAPNNNLFEESSHGMSVASIIVGNAPGNFVGAAPQASVWLLRSEDAASEYVVEEDNWTAAAEFADSVGADIINSSLGYITFDDYTQNHSYSQLDGKTTIVTRAACIAAAKGIIVCNSAGNNGEGKIGAPADADNIISVGAVDENREIASFSSIGPSADGRIKPSVCAQGRNTALVSSSGNITKSNGTSFSSPILAGVAACLWQANPEKSNIEIIDAIIKSADKYTNPNIEYGFGIPNLAAANIILKRGETEISSEKNTLITNPNPFEDTIDVIISTKAEFSISISLVDSAGKIVITKNNVKLKKGYNYILIDEITGLKSGMYVLNVYSTEWSSSAKLIKK